MSRLTEVVLYQYAYKATGNDQTGRCRFRTGTSVNFQWRIGLKQPIIGEIHNAPFFSDADNAPDDELNVFTVCIDDDNVILKG